MKVLYKTAATATAGRDGRAVSEDGVLDVKLAMPKELGGAGGAATNPEQLFAAGYAACFLSALKFVAMQQKQTLPAEATVKAEVGIGQAEVGFALDIELQVNLPGLHPELAQSLLQTAHQVCPYSNATRGNIVVRLLLL
ncbi:organic hydroperoxide resistance protein [Rheinheimera sp.]|uniref:organic hydroperoxide resistance protein n=1 Tax=Rheinheimera sp. TaxID=1869214 RepID=UPI0027BB036A|nr:organic hydroperoxide resistance protein [Rheinheimera sp.]